MKHLLVLITLFFFVVGCNKIDESQIEIKGELIFKIGEEKPFTGKLITRNKKDKIHFESTYKDGKKEGVSKGYYENGNLNWEENYKDGNLVQEK